MSTPDPGRYVLKASCGSRLGTVARISGFLAQRPRSMRCVEREGLSLVHLPVTPDTKAAQEQRLHVEHRLALDGERSIVFE